MEELGLTIAAKSKVVSNRVGVADSVAAGLAGRSCAIGSARAAEDLGVSTAGGARRAVASFTKRLQKAAKRGARVGRLAATSAAAKKLFTTGVDKQQSYEAVIHGAAPPQLLRMRRNACSCLPPAGSQPCPATFLAGRLG